MSEEKKFEQMYHLVGEQAIPIYLTAIQFPKDVKHYLLTTESEKTQKSAESLLRTFKANGYSAEIRSLGASKNAFSFRSLLPLFRTIYEETNPTKEPSALNITGGTKPMSFTSFLVAEKYGTMHTCYLDFPEHQLYWMDGTVTPVQTVLKISDFIQLAGLELREKKSFAAETSFVNFLFQHASLLQRYQGDFAAAANNIFPKKEYPSAKVYFEKKFDEFANSFKPSEKESWKEFWAAFTTPAGQKHMSWQAQSKFLGGGWFENYVYTSLKNTDKQITEILQGAEVIIPDSDAGNSMQELDVVYTDGYSLTILECKAGIVTQDHVQKLENLGFRFAGALGVSALVSLNEAGTKSNKQLLRCLEISRLISGFFGAKGIQRLKKQPISFEAGKIYE